MGATVGATVDRWVAKWVKTADGFLMRLQITLNNIYINLLLALVAADGFLMSIYALFLMQTQITDEFVMLMLDYIRGIWHISISTGFIFYLNNKYIVTKC